MSEIPEELALLNTPSGQFFSLKRNDGWMSGQFIFTEAKGRQGALCLFHSEELTFTTEQEQSFKALITIIQQHLTTQDELKNFRTNAKGIEMYANIVRTDSDGFISYVNDLFCKMSGYSRSQLMGKRMNLLKSGHHSKEFFAQMWKTINQGIPWRGEIKNRCKDGSTHWVDAMIVPIFDAQNNIIEFVSYRYDITERKKIEEKYLASELNFRNIFHQAGDGIVTVEGPDWKFTSANQAALEMFGVKNQDDFLGKNPELFSPPYQPCGELSLRKAAAMIEKTLKEGSHIFEWIHTKMDGCLFQCSIVLSRVVVDDRSFIQMAMRDISKERRAEKELTRALNEKKFILDRLGIGIWTFDPHKNQLELDETCLGHFEISKKKNNDLDIWKSLLDPLDLEKFNNEIHQSALLKKDVEFNYSLKTLKGNHRHFGVKGKFIEESEGKGVFYGIKWDRTKEVEMEKVLDEEKLKVLRSAKLASIGELAAGVGHEINNPLAIMSGQIFLVEQELSTETFSTNELIGRIKIIENSIERIANIVKGLRAFSRSDEKEITRLDVFDMASETINMLREIYTRDGLEVSLSGQKGEFFVFGNRGKLQQVLLNLISNARDATEGKKNRKIHASLSQEGDLVSLKVSDNGHGIKDIHREKIFNPFFTTKELHKGTGIGLTLSRTIMKEHRGRLEFISEVDKGTTFSMMMPFCDKKDVTEKQLPNKVSSSLKFKGHVLVVDDEEELRDILQFMLVRMGLQVTVAASARDVLSRIESEQFDLVISDLKMPDINGFELLKRIRSKKIPQPDFVFITGGLDMDEQELEEVYQHSQGVLPKPFKKEDIMDKLKELLPFEVS